MAYKVVKSKGSVYGLTQRKFIVDTASEIIDLPTNKKKGKAQAGDTVSDELCAIGSLATVTETGDTYELNASSTWVKKPAEGSGSDVTIDNTLTQEGQAADAKAVGDALANKANSSDLANYMQTSTADGKYATKSELSSYAKTSELPKGTAVSNATGADDVVTQLNALLSSLKTAGIIASS